MNIAILKEKNKNENRVAITPSVVKKFIDEGFTVSIEQSAGVASAFIDEEYTKVGAFVGDMATAIAKADVVVAVQCPVKEQIDFFKEGTVLMSFVFPDVNSTEFEMLKSKNTNVFAMEAVPRISRAQSMDALSSQSNLSGYKSVILGANALTKIFPLLMTSAGTVTPANVLIYGAGVAGLQAIATAKRLGAVVEVTDVRPETKEEVQSLGGKFIEVESDEVVETEGGYAKTASTAYLQKQKAAVEQSLFRADLVVTTALVMGKKAPVLITKNQVEKMRFGSVIVDMAVEQGGNCELSEPGKTIMHNGVKIIGATNLPSTLATNASELYAKNIFNLLMHLATKEGFKWDAEEEITKGCLIFKGNK